MDTKDMQCIGLVTSNRSPKTPDARRRRPHVPSSKPTMSKNHQIAAGATKSGGQPSPPAFKVGGHVVRPCWLPVV
jgi:hypothetical protein